MKEIKKQERQSDSDEGIEWQTAKDAEGTQGATVWWEMGGDLHAWERGGGFDIQQR